MSEVSNLKNNSKKRMFTFKQLETQINSCTLRVRVTNKSGIKRFNNGKLFNLDLLDKAGEFRCTVFNENVDKFYNELEVGKQYIIGGFILSSANQKFSPFLNRMEIQLTEASIVEIDDKEDMEKLPKNKFSFCNFIDLKNTEKDVIVDLFGVIEKIDDIEEIFSKNGVKFIKRTVTLRDEKMNSICFVVWNDNAYNFKGEIDNIIVIKGGKVLEYKGIRSISIGMSTVLLINPVDIPEVEELQQLITKRSNEN